MSDPLPGWPRRRSGAPDWLVATPYCHRGLHGEGRIENSRAAFDAAIAIRHGIELDVQASRDGRAMVFHDYELDRLTGETGRVAERTAAVLGGTRLRGSDEGIATLGEILDLVGGRAPLLIEAKAPDDRVAALCRDIVRALEGYAGSAAVMSFNPEVGGWLRLHAPGLIRGLVVSEQGKRGWRGRIERRLSLWRARPDFLACDIRDLPSAFAAGARARGLAILTWTVRTAADRGRAALHADQIIYEAPAVEPATDRG